MNLCPTYLYVVCPHSFINLLLILFYQATTDKILYVRCPHFFINLLMTRPSNSIRRCSQGVKAPLRDCVTHVMTRTASTSQQLQGAKAPLLVSLVDWMTISEDRICREQGAQVPLLNDVSDGGTRTARTSPQSQKKNLPCSRVWFLGNWKGRLSLLQESIGIRIFVYPLYWQSRSSGKTKYVSLSMSPSLPLLKKKIS